MLLSNRVQIDLDALALGDEREKTLARVIAEETETQRSIERARHGGAPEFQVSLGLLTAEKADSADLQPWEVLLTFGDCLKRAAERAGVSGPELVVFAMDRCRPQHVWVLFWFSRFLAFLHHAASESTQAWQMEQELVQLRERQQRISEGARQGGLKSAKTRRANQRTPSKSVLDAEREKLIKEGINPREVNGRLAQKYSVTPGAIRAALNRD